MNIVSRSVQKKLLANVIEETGMLPICLFVERYLYNKEAINYDGF
jgi:hypothetical protein